MKPRKNGCAGALLRCAMLASSPAFTVCLGRCASCALRCIRLANFFRASSVLLALLFIFPAHAVDGISPKLDIGKGGQCVNDPQFMRKNHMDLLIRQRDETVRQGIRGGKYSLAGCVDCHASKKNNSVLGSNEHFCQGCHVYAGVRIDCFECHSSKRSVVAEVGK